MTAMMVICAVSVVVVTRIVVVAVNINAGAVVVIR